MEKLRLYKHNFKRDGQKVLSKKYYMDVRFEGKRFRVALFESKKTSETTAKRIQELVALKISEEAPGPDLQKWISQQKPSFAKRLASLGLVTESRLSAGVPLYEHLRDFKSHLAATGVTANQAAQQAARATRILSEAGCRKLQDIAPGKVMAAIDSLQAVVLRKKKDKLEPVNSGPASSLTKRHHLRALKQFCKWLKRDGRTTTNPIEDITLRNAQVETHRRALTADEIKTLLAHAESAGPIAGTTGPERALIYRLALETGLRRNEIRSLTRTSFDFEGPSVRVEAKHSKTRKAATLPIKATTMARIKNHLASKTPTAPAFVLTEYHTAELLQKDLQNARQQWLAAVKDNPAEHLKRTDSDFLKDKTAEGKIDFHALRHTFATMLVQGGVDIKTAQTLLRHSTPAMTLEIYTHARNENLSNAIDSLPSFDEPSEAAQKQA